ncbi:hypothetical protein K438DRAFT_2064056 [Mycena galopus ATCC 62051]|nr:hypothetical protein K438DRAFT_2064056 [Mycena galopus ATCC 62051]
MSVTVPHKRGTALFSFSSTPPHSYILFFPPRYMANFTTVLLGSFSRIFFSHTLPSSQSDPDLTAERAAAHDRSRPASSASMRPRPRSAFEGYWSWEGPSSGMILRQGTPQDPGLKGLADVKITHSSPVFASQPPRAPTPPTTADVSSPTAVLHEFDTSFDISLISDTSTSEDADDSFESEFNNSCTFPPPPAPPLVGLGLGGLFKPDGSPFDGMGVVSFGCDAAGHGTPRRTTGGLSRAFLEEAAWTWAADPHHQMLTVIQEEEASEVQLEESQIWANGDHGINRRDTGSSRKIKKTKTSVTPPVVLTRDLSTVDTVSSGLKRQNQRSNTSAPRTISTPRSLSVVQTASRPQPAWRG